VEWVPTLEDARARGLTLVLDPPGLFRGPRDVLPIEPTRVVRQTAIIVVGSFVRRSRTSFERRVLPSVAHAFPAVAQEPRLDMPLENGRIELLDGILGRGPCTNDTKHRGYEEHSACNGAGCPDCNDTGEVACSVCKGEGEWLTVNVVFVTEERGAFHNVYSPRDLPLSLDDRVQAVLGALATPPEALEWHGLAAVAQLGYRDAAQDAHAVRGFSLAPAMETAQRFLDELKRTSDQSDTRVWAWPLLRLYYEGVGQALLFVAPDGTLEVHGAVAERHG